MKPKRLVRVTETIALVSVCFAASLLPFHAHALACGAGLVTLGCGFVAFDIWQVWNARQRFLQRDQVVNCGDGATPRSAVNVSAAS